MDKRGISPLIATVLLLFFAIGLGIVVMNWGRAHVEAASKCAIDTGMSVVRLNDVPEVCYSGSGADGYIHFIVENGPNIDIESLQFRVIGAKGIYTADIKESIKIGYSLMKDMPYDFDQFGGIRQIKMSPMVVLYPGEDPILCPEQAIVSEEIRSC